MSAVECWQLFNRNTGIADSGNADKIAKKSTFSAGNRILAGGDLNNAETGNLETLVIHFRLISL